MSYPVGHRTPWFVASFVATLLVVAACSSGSSGDGAAGGDATSAAPAGATPTATADEAPADQEMAELVQGKAVGEFFLLNCSPCHGLQRQGIVGPPLTADALTKEDAFYVETITNGRTGTVMPSWSQAGLTQPEIRAIVHWLKTETP